MTDCPAADPKADNDAREPMGKLAYLNAVERHVPMLAEVDSSRPKYFVTFPYPYMNGKLHLGHLYSISKADFAAYFRAQQGYNVLFPFAFHCTGMPISASAAKLREELSGRPVDLSVASILASFHITDPAPFTDPLHWVRTFPKAGRATLEAYHAAIDWRRSFVTTSLNPYYDSFVRYQFNRLRSAGCLAFGKRYSIFCPVDRQPCLDHDRRRGEGIKPVETVLAKIPFGDATLLVRYPVPSPATRIVVSRSQPLVRFVFNDRAFLIEEPLYENLRWQVSELTGVDKGVDHQSIRTNSCALKATGEFVDFASVPIEFTDNPIAPKIVCGIGVVSEALQGEHAEIIARRNETLSVVESQTFVKVYEPGGPVISRAGGQCVVSLTDQWYIDYSDSSWKAKVKECIYGMELTVDTRAKFEESLDWIGKWGFSRSFGLGTRVPWDEQYMIDSLSDSTIYMAFYTVKHLFFGDLEGSSQIFPAELLCDALWDFILRDGKKATAKGQTGDDLFFEQNPLLEPHRSLLETARGSFRYFYPVDLRVSGKDLIGNHLLFFLFNHVALFDREQWPRRIFTNGYVMLNAAKMSKSEGNFLSAEDALQRFGASATRMCLATCGDTNEDANFEESIANALVLKLYSLAKAVEGLPEISNEIIDAEVSRIDQEGRGMNRSGEQQCDADLALFLDQFLVQMLGKNISASVAAYGAMVFRDAVKFAFYENLHLIEQYACLGGTNRTLVAYAYRTIVQLCYPLTPSLCKYLADLKFGGRLSLPTAQAEGGVFVDAVLHVKALCGRITASRRKQTGVTLVVGRTYPGWKTDCMKAVDKLRDGTASEKEQKTAIIAATTPVLAGAGVPQKKGLVFVMDYLKNPGNYMASFDELAVLRMFRNYMSGAVGIEVSVSEGENGEPLSPALVFQ